MARPSWVSTDLTKAFFAAERAISPRLEAALRTDAGLDVIAVSIAVRRLAGRALKGATNGVIEAVGLPSSRQLRLLHSAIDERQEGSA